MIKKTKRFLNHSWLAWCFAAALTLPGLAADGQTETLTWKLAAGDQFEATLTQTTNAVTQIDSREKANRGSTTIRMAWNVVSVSENGDATIEQSLSSIRLTSGNPEVPGQAVSYDTASDQKISKLSKQLLDQVMPLIGLKFTVVMAPTGEIKRVMLPPESEEILGGLPDAMPLRELFSESGLKELQGSSVINLPNKSLSEGESWTVEQEMSTPFGQWNRKQVGTLVGEKTVDGRRVAEFSLATTMEPLAAATNATPSVDLAGTLAGKLISSTGSGTLIMDIDAGYFSTCKIRNEALTEKPYREKTIITTVINEIEMTLVKK